MPHESAAAIAQRAARSDASAASQAPERLRAGLHAAIAYNYATATQWILGGMAVALGLCFLVALRHHARDGTQRPHLISRSWIEVHRLRSGDARREMNIGTLSAVFAIRGRQG